MITEEINKKYLENPDKCPFCGSDSLRGEEIDRLSSSTFMYRGVQCYKCKESWNENFKLESITEIN